MKPKISTTPTQEQPAPPALADATIDALESLRVKDLRELCETAGLPSGGRKADLVDRVRSARFGGASGRYVPGKTLCKYCGEPIRVRSTQPPIEDGETGRITQTRHVQCTARKPHRYKIVEQING